MKDKNFGEVMEMNENYKKVLELCKVLIEKNYAPCGLEDEVKKRLLELTLEWEKRKEKADREGKTIGGLGVLRMDVSRAVGKAGSDAKKSGKSKCYYLRQGVQIPVGKPGALGNYFMSMTE